MVGRQVVTSGSEVSANGIATVMAAAAMPFAGTPAPAAPAPIDMELVYKKVLNMTAEKHEAITKAATAALKVADFATRDSAYIAWTSAGTNLAALGAFVEVTKMLGSSEGCAKFDLDSTYGAEVAKKMREVASRAFIDSTEQFPLNTFQQLQCPSPHFQKSWMELVKMVGNTDAKAVKAAAPGTSVRVEEMDWFNTAMETQQAKYMALLEQDAATTSAQQSSIFGAAPAVTKKHPLLLSTSQYSKFVLRGLVDAILDDNKQAEVFEQWKTITDMVNMARTVAVLDAVVSTPAAAVWKSVSPSNTLFVDALAKKNLQKTAVKHALVAANYVAKQGIMSANAKTAHLNAFLSELIPTDDLPTATAHHALMTRLAAFQQDPATPFAVKNAAKEVVAEQVLSDTDAGCLRTLFPEETDEALGPMVTKQLTIMTAKLNANNERVIVNNKVELVPLESVDKNLKTLVQQFIFGRAKIACDERAAAKQSEADAVSTAQTVPVSAASMFV